MKLKRVLVLYFFIVILLSYGVSANKKVKNIIFMVPDGLAISNVTAARIYKYGTNKERLNFEKLENIGYQSTYSQNSMVTDSAAAASAWACGEKFKNGEISFHSDTEKKPKTILEISKEIGKSTGLVATSTITHATPAAFGSHIGNRSCESEIARQYIVKTKVDVILGGGKSIFNTNKNQKDRCGTSGDFIKLAKEKGYTVVFNRDDMNNSSNGKKLLGLFSNRGLKPVYKKSSSGDLENEPTLEEMTSKALSILEKNRKGFFLLVEGSQIDWANHRNNLEYQIKEIIEFDKAVKIVLDWVKAKKSRMNNTLIIVVSDHDCGGFAITGPERLITEPGRYVEEGWVWGSHTGEDTMIWSQGPYSKYLGKAIDNTNIFYIIKAALKGEPYKN